MTITREDIVNYLLDQGYGENWRTDALAAETYEWLTSEDPTIEQLETAVRNAIEVFQSQEQP